jgi:hypothetical protein
MPFDQILQEYRSRICGPGMLNTYIVVFVTSELDDLLFFLHLSCIPVSQLSTLNGTLGDDILGATHFTATSRFRGHVLSVTHLFTFPEYPFQLSNKTPPYYRIPYPSPH